MGFEGTDQERSNRRDWWGSECASGLVGEFQTRAPASGGKSGDAVTAGRWGRKARGLGGLCWLALALMVGFLQHADGNSIYVVGYNDYGQLGLGDYLQRSTQTKMIATDMPLQTVRGVAAGLYHNIVFGELADGDIGVVYSWGRNTKGQLGTGSKLQTSAPTLVKWDLCPEPNSWVCTPKLCKDVCDVGSCTGFGRENPWWKAADMHCVKPQDKIWTSGSHPQVIQVTTTEDASFVLTVEGNVYSWGSNDWGQLGITDFEEEDIARPDGGYLRDVPQFVKLLKDEIVLGVVGGAFHVAALTDRGELWVWGQNAEGQLGLGDFSQRNQPTKVDFLVGINIVKMASGAYHTLVLTDEGVVYTTGLNDNGQLGHGDLESRKVPTVVTALLTRNVSAVAAGDYASYIVTDAGEVYSWGNNAYQQLGLDIPKVTQRILVPTRIDSLFGLSANIYSIVGGQRTVFAVDQGSDIYAIGNNDFGMLGTGDETQRASPEKVPVFVGENVFQVASGAYHSVAITGCFDLALPCSGHGRCDGDGKCLCDTGYKGYRCADACPGGVGNACNNNGDCITPLGGASFCICFAGYIGADCSNECPGGALSTCSNNGICLEDGTCQCNTGWSGLNCSTPCPGTKALPCSGLGQCSEGSCNCFLGFAGLNCSTECDGGAYNPCSYNGECQFDGSCKCFKGFRRSDCSCECPGGAENTCFGRGSCNDQCTCDCRTGYRGQNCSVDCPGGFNSWMNGEAVIIHVCSGHGECDAKGECYCDVAWSGDACEIGPPDFTIVILSTAAGLLGCCCIAGIASIIRRRKMKIGERERKRQARKKLRSKKKNKGGKSKDRSKRKGKVDK